MTDKQDEINLRPYIVALINNWWRIGLLAFVAAVAAFGLSWLQTRVYTASATVLLTHSQASLRLAEQFPTIQENVYDSNSRMDALISIAQSDAIAINTLDLIRDSIPAEDRELEVLKNRVDITRKGDSIIVEATAETPNLAAEIANTWAHQVEAAINQAYSGDQPLEEIQNQVNVAKRDYDLAQVALEEFLQDNQISYLDKKISEARGLLSEVVNDRSWHISNAYYRKQSMQNLKDQAEALKNQLQGRSSSNAGNLGDAIAIMNARARSFGIGEVSNVRVVEDDQKSEKFATFESAGQNIDLQLSDINSMVESNPNYLAEVDELIQQADSEIQKADQTLVDLTEKMMQGEGDEQIQAINAQIGVLETQMESEQARRRELNSTRDLAWDAYQALVQKESEITIASQTNNQVILASPAIPPQKPAPRGTIRNTLVAGVLGMMVGIFGVLALMWWQFLDEPGKIEEKLVAAD